MDELNYAIDMLVERQGLLSDYDSLNLTPLDDNNTIYEFEAINDMSDIERYLIYNASKKQDIEDYFKFERDLDTKNYILDVFFIPVIIFNNWDDEMNFYQSVFDKLKTAKERRRLKDIFASKISIYMELNQKISLNIDDEVNYLEYLDERNSYTSNVKGYIYNISFYELKKLFNVTGNDLFKKNIRKGNKGDKTISDIKKEFKKYLCVHVYNALRTEIDRTQLEELLGISKDVLVNNSPNKFWFCHNGITIFSYDQEEFGRIGKKIVLNPKNVSVINGAQTITGFYNSIKELKLELLSIFQDFDNINIDIDKSLEDASKSIFVKSIIIQGNENYVKPITCGLNTQVPILPEHIIADSDEARRLNKILKKENIEIVPEGYNSVFDQGYSALDFAKKYLICIKQPGRSKNLRKNDLKSIIEQAVDRFNGKSEELLKEFRTIGEIDKWWKTYKKEREELYLNEEDVVFCKYGKNYFTSYVLDNDYSSEDYFLAFDEFVKSMKKVSHNEITLNDFKKDDLFKSYLDNKGSMKKTYENNKISKFDCNQLLAYLQNNIKSRYSISVVISNYLSKCNIQIENFRVINRISGKCCEAYPFTGSVFSEIYQTNSEYDNKYIVFDDSKFKQSLEKEFPLFVLDNEVKEDNKKEIVKVHFIEKFTFKDYIEDGRNVFNKTIEAFQKGDETLFPKVSQKLNFHVRPKAINASDTFEFSNGNNITKRTFWANKDLINELITCSINKEVE
ncbi:hypothetical protein [Candidatus Stoquefichus massiliensis]|uniref:hypothetical protein n=1 Tax=Candidatus Stoquefichus massiliensis TaxID=1470350 RepID=UPI0004AEBFC4|nr:hypothetical protein [Candidatus Stoquefichus massiliensis]